ncbi:hypothetical protein FACS1894211_14620 [Clostridia bacterium]|nr:hypothetical protein FACS1894211_14620 [Clostridia bacterium]
MNKKKLTSEKPMLSLPAKIAYGAGMFPYSVLQQTLFPLALLFSVDAMRLPGWLAGIALTLGLLVHAVCDPLARRLSDKASSVVFGKRYGFYILGVFVSALVNIFLWSMPAAAPGWQFLWLALSVMLISVLISCMQMPYNALGDELAGDAAEKRAIHTVKNLFFIASLAVPLILMGAILRDSAAPEGYMNLALILSGGALIAGTAAFFTTYPHLPRLRAKAVRPEGKYAGGFSLKKLVLDYFSVLKRRDERAVVLGYCTALMSVAFLSGTGLLFLIHTLRLPVFLVALDLGLLFLAAIGAQFFWPRAAARWGKKHAVLAGVVVTLSGILLMSVAFIAAYYFGAEFSPEWLAVPACAVCGFGIGAVFCVPSAMIADMHKDDAAAPDVAGMLNFFYRTGYAAVLLLSGALISIFNYGGTNGEGGLIRGALGWIVVMGASLALGLSVWLFQSYGKPPRAKQLRIKGTDKLKAENGKLKPEDGTEQGTSDKGQVMVAVDKKTGTESSDGQVTIEELAGDERKIENGELRMEDGTEQGISDKRQVADDIRTGGRTE